MVSYSHRRNHRCQTIVWIKCRKCSTSNVFHRTPWYTKEFHKRVSSWKSSIESTRGKNGKLIPWFLFSLYFSFHAVCCSPYIFNINLSWFDCFLLAFGRFLCAFILILLLFFSLSVRVLNVCMWMVEPSPNSWRYFVIWCCHCSFVSVIGCCSFFSLRLPSHCVLFCLLFFFLLFSFRSVL